MKIPKQVSWYKQKLEKSIEVACSLGAEVHILRIEEVTLIGTDGPQLPYAFCPEHKAYFGISADVNMQGMILRLNEDPLVDIEEEKNHVGQ